MKGISAVGVIAAGLFSAMPAHAWQSIDDPAKDAQCAFMQTFDTPGQTTVVVSQNQQQFDDDDSVSLIVYNKNWSLQNGENVTDTISITSNLVKISVEGPRAVDNGLGLTVSHEHMQSFADADPLLVVVSKGDQAIARLNFAGFGQSWARFEACRGAKVAARNARQEDVPLNPFAKPAPRPRQAAHRKSAG